LDLIYTDPLPLGHAQAAAFGTLVNMALIDADHSMDIVNTSRILSCTHIVCFTDIVFGGLDGFVPRDTGETCVSPGVVAADVG
jgi:hypothetical protein